MSDKEMQTCNMDERTNEEKLLDQISELQNEVSANKIFKSSDEKLIERLIAETADRDTRIASLEAQLNKKELEAEEAECAHMVLDDMGIDREQAKGNVYSLVGRIGLLKAESDDFKEQSEHNYNGEG